MLTRFVRAQLVIFAVLSVLGLTVMGTVYMKLPQLLGVGSITVYLDLPETGGLYRFGNVTYRGVQVGKVTAVDLTDDGVRATLTLDTDHPIPADLEAMVRSVSAVGEQYVELRPRTDQAPYLDEGAVIPLAHTDVPQPVGPMLDSLSAMVGTVPTDRMYDLLGELSTGLGASGHELDALLASGRTLADALERSGPAARTFVQDAVPLLDAQARSLDAVQVWTRSLAGVTGQLVTDDPQLRAILREGPGLATEATRLFESVELTLPVLLANLTSVGQLAVTYNAGLEQLLVLLPPSISMIQTVQPTKNASGLGLGTFRFGNMSEPAACTVGFLPPTEWRSPHETETLDTPDGLYCKLPQDSDIAVRGVRNTPCAGQPGKYAPTAELCHDAEGFVPLATEQPLLGPYPRDPGLEDQGIAPDTRPIPAESPPGDAPASAPASSPADAPAIGAARYDPATGTYLASDGRVYQQGDLATEPNRPWTEMLPH
ncbi:MCE family protein [Nocardia higoensis]|uniref:MCE family protein n=1 Tax=Nocardia higoensis TaxID=228599 RepID=A0ABS0D6Q0_9NOCA|nr:MCE family protein [Nocardia higoensis]